MLRKFVFVVMLLLMVVPVVQAQELSDAAFEETINRANQLIPNLGRPDRWEFQILLPSTDSAVMCPLVPGFKTDTTRQPFIVSLFYGETEYILHAAGDGSIIQPCDPKFGNIGMQPLPTLPQAGDTCTATPANGEFANVRITPDVDAEQVGTMTTQELVLGRNEDTTWYLVGLGWIAGTVVNVAGDCSPNILPARDPNIVTFTAGVQAPSADGTIVTPVPLSTEVAALPTDFVCPPNFTGYLAPRIQTGLITAQVEQGGIPNTLRALPTIDSERVGQIQPGRRIDRVWNGPQCSDGYVWWEVEVDGVRGWTAESSAADDEYFLRPTAGNAVEDEVAPMPDSDVAALPQTAITMSNLASVRLATQLPYTNVEAFAWGSANQFALSSEDILRQLEVADAANPTVITEGTATQPFSAFAYQIEREELVSGDTMGMVMVFSKDTPAPVQIRAHESAINEISFSPDGSVFATGSGSETTAEDTWTLRLWDFARISNNEGDAALLRSIRFPYPVRDVAFSANGEYVAVVAERTDAEAGAALWIYGDSGLGDNILTLVLENTEGQAFVEAVPTASEGDFVYAQGDTLYSLDVASGTERVLTRQSGLVLTDVTFSPVADEVSQLMVVTTTSSSAPDAPSGGIPMLAFNYVNMTETSVGTVVDTLTADEVAFNMPGTVLAVRDLFENTVRFYAVQ